MPSCTPPCLFFRPCRNFSVYVEIFPTMREFFPPCPISKEEFFPPCQNFSHHVGIFPSMSEFFPIPILQVYAGKNLLLVDGRDPRSIWCKKTLWVAVKIFLYLLRESSVIFMAIFRKSAETLSFFLQCMIIKNGFPRLLGYFGFPDQGHLKVLSSEMDQAESRLIR